MEGRRVPRGPSIGPAQEPPCHRGQARSPARSGLPFVSGRLLIPREMPVSWGKALLCPARRCSRYRCRKRRWPSPRASGPRSTNSHAPGPATKIQQKRTIAPYHRVLTASIRNVAVPPKSGPPPGFQGWDLKPDSQGWGARPRSRSPPRPHEPSRNGPKDGAPRKPRRAFPEMRHGWRVPYCAPQWAPGWMAPIETPPAPWPPSDTQIGRAHV